MTSVSRTKRMKGVKCYTSKKSGTYRHAFNDERIGRSDFSQPDLLTSSDTKNIPSSQHRREPILAFAHHSFPRDMKYLLQWWDIQQPKGLHSFIVVAFSQQIAVQCFLLAVLKPETFTVVFRFWVMIVYALKVLPYILCSAYNHPSHFLMAYFCFSPSFTELPKKLFHLAQCNFFFFFFAFITK